MYRVNGRRLCWARGKNLARFCGQLLQSFLETSPAPFVGLGHDFTFDLSQTWAEVRGGRWTGTLDSISCDNTASKICVSAGRGTVTTSSLSTVSRCPLAVARFPAGEVAGENMNTRHLPAG